MKRLICFLLVFSMFTVLLPATTFAVSPVDLSRVKFNTGSQPLVFSFGSVSMHGELRQYLPFTCEEIDKLVDQVLKRMAKTLWDIRLANEAVQKANKAREFTPEDAKRAREDIIKVLGATGYGSAATVLDALNKYLSTNSWDELGRTATDQLEDSLTGWVKDTAGDMLSNTPADVVKKGADIAGKAIAVLDVLIAMEEAQTRTKQKYTDLSKGADARIFLQEFYFRLNDLIQDYKRRSDEEGWHIAFERATASDGRYFTFYGVPGNLQTWALDMTLYQRSTDQYGSAVGEYSGEFYMSVDHEMSNFNRNILTALRNMPDVGKRIAQIESTKGLPNFALTSQGSTRITRAIFGTATATIDSSGTITLNLTPETDDKIVTIRGFNAETKFSASAPGVSADISFGCNVSSKDNNLVVELSTTGATGSLGLNTGGGAGPVTVPLDTNLWKPWDEGEKTLRHE
jgi:DNA-directed RNA polymerase subunit F